MLMWLMTLVMSVHADFVSSPEKCLSTKSYPCVVLTKSKSTISLGENGFYFAANTLVSFTAPEDVFVVRGHLWGVAKKTMRIKTQYGSFESAPTGSEYWMSVDKDMSTLKVFTGSVQAAPKGGDSVEVNPGRQVHVSAVDYSQKSCFISNVSVFDFNEYVRTYGRVFPFGAISVEEHLQKVAGAVLTASFIDSVILKKQVSRQLASDIARDHRLKVQREEASRLEIYLRKLFRIKSNFED